MNFNKKYGEEIFNQRFSIFFSVKEMQKKTNKKNGRRKGAKALNFQIIKRKAK